MGKSENNRFIIDKIDKRLGSVDAELKFDTIMIGVGLLIVIVFSFLLGLTIKSHPILSVVFTMLIVFGLFLSYYMTKEYFADLRKKS